MLFGTDIWLTWIFEHNETSIDVITVYVHLVCCMSVGVHSEWSPSHQPVQQVYIVYTTVQEYPSYVEYNHTRLIRTL